MLNKYVLLLILIVTSYPVICEPMTEFSIAKHAAERGYVTQQYKVGGMYHFGLGVDIDLQEARKWYTAAAEKGHSGAQNALGLLESESENLDASVKWHTLAAKSGEATYQNNLAITLLKLGRNREAFEWFLLAANSNERYAQMKVAEMYRDGDGVSKNLAESLYWYKVLAIKGDPNAQHNLGMMYANGEGIPQNTIKAYIWLSLAASYYGVNSKSSLYRDQISRKLNSEQLVNAQRVSEICFSTGFKQCDFDQVTNN